MDTRWKSTENEANQGGGSFDGSTLEPIFDGRPVRIKDSASIGIDHLHLEIGTSAEVDDENDAFNDIRRDDLRFNCCPSLPK